MSGRHNECVSSSRVQCPSIPPFISPTGLPPSCHPSISAHKRLRRSRAELGKRVCLTRSHRTLVFLPRHALRTPNGPSRMRTHTPTRTVRYRNRSPVCTLIGPRPVSFAFSAPSLRCVVHGLPRLAPVDRSSTRLSGFLLARRLSPFPLPVFASPLRSKRPMAETFRRSVSPAVVRVSCPVVIECRHGATRLTLVLSKLAVVPAAAVLGVRWVVIGNDMGTARANTEAVLRFCC